MTAHVGRIVIPTAKPCTPDAVALVVLVRRGIRCNRMTAVAMAGAVTSSCRSDDRSHSWFNMLGRMMNEFCTGA